MDTMYNAAVAAVKGCDKVHGCNDYDHTPCLQRKILEYFESNDDIDVPNKMAQSRLHICHSYSICLFIRQNL